MFNRANDIFVASETLLGMNAFEENGDVSAKYYLKSPDMLESFQKELREKRLDNCYDVVTDTTTYETIVAPVKGLSKVTGTFLIVILVLGAVILTFLSTFAIRERKYEIGVLRAMGMMKSKVAIGITCEMLMITAIGLTLDLGIGYFASQPVANVLLAGQVEAAANSMAPIAIPIGQEPVLKEAPQSTSAAKSMNWF